MIVMADRELEAIKRKKLRELQRKIGMKDQQKVESEDHKILRKIFKGHAWEVFNAAAIQFPEATVRIGKTLAQLALAGKLKEVKGAELITMFRNVGLPVRLKTEIKFIDNGKSKSIAEKLR